MSAPTREQWLAVTCEIKANVDRIVGLLSEPWSEARSVSDVNEAAETAYQLGYDAGRRSAGFPDPPPCPSWCDGKHGIDPDDWESEDKLGVVVARCHGHHVGDIAGKVNVEVVADTTAERGQAPVTSEPMLSLDVSADAELNATDARNLAHLLIRAADELEYDLAGGGQ